MDLTNFSLIEERIWDIRFGTITIYKQNAQNDLLIFEKARNSNSKEDHRFSVLQAKERNKLQHPSMLQMLGIFCDDKAWVTKAYFDYPNQDLLDSKASLKDPREMVRFFSDMLEVVIYLQELDMVHGDIRAEFIFKHPQLNKYVLLDRMIDDSSVFQAQKNNIFQADKELYMSPELFQQLVRTEKTPVINPYKNEVFSLGLLLLSVITSDYDFYDLYDRGSFEFHSNGMQQILDNCRPLNTSEPLSMFLKAYVTEHIVNVDPKSRALPKQALSFLRNGIFQLINIIGPILSPPEREKEKRGFKIGQLSKEPIQTIMELEEDWSMSEQSETNSKKTLKNKQKNQSYKNSHFNSEKHKEEKIERKSTKKESESDDRNLFIHISETESSFLNESQKVSPSHKENKEKILQLLKNVSVSESGRSSIKLNESIEKIKTLNNIYEPSISHLDYFLLDKNTHSTNRRMSSSNPNSNNSSSFRSKGKGDTLNALKTENNLKEGGEVENVKSLQVNNKKNFFLDPLEMIRKMRSTETISNNNTINIESSNHESIQMSNGIFRETIGQRHKSKYFQDLESVKHYDMDSNNLALEPQSVEDPTKQVFDFSMVESVSNNYFSYGAKSTPKKNKKKYFFKHIIKNSNEFPEFIKEIPVEDSQKKEEIDDAAKEAASNKMKGIQFSLSNLDFIKGEKKDSPDLIEGKFYACTDDKKKESLNEKDASNTEFTEETFTESINMYNTIMTESDSIQHTDITIDNVKGMHKKLENESSLNTESNPNSQYMSLNLRKTKTRSERKIQKNKFNNSMPTRQENKPKKTNSAAISTRNQEGLVDLILKNTFPEFLDENFRKENGMTSDKKDKDEKTVSKLISINPKLSTKNYSFLNNSKQIKSEPEIKSPNTKENTKYLSLNKKDLDLNAVKSMEKILTKSAKKIFSKLSVVLDKSKEKHKITVNSNESFSESITTTKNSKSNQINTDEMIESVNGIKIEGKNIKRTSADELGKTKNSSLTDDFDDLMDSLENSLYDGQEKEEQFQLVIKNKQEGGNKNKFVIQPLKLSEKKDLIRIIEVEKNIEQKISLKKEDKKAIKKVNELKSKTVVYKKEFPLVSNNTAYKSRNSNNTNYLTDSNFTKKERMLQEALKENTVSPDTVTDKSFKHNFNFNSDYSNTSKESLPIQKLPKEKKDITNKKELNAPKPETKTGPSIFFEKQFDETHKIEKESNQFGKKLNQSNKINSTSSESDLCNFSSLESEKLIIKHDLSKFDFQKERLNNIKYQRSQDHKTFQSTRQIQKGLKNFKNAFINNSLSFYNRFKSEQEKFDKNNKVFMQYFPTFESKNETMETFNSSESNLKTLRSSLNSNLQSTGKNSLSYKTMPIKQTMLNPHSQKTIENISSKNKKNNLPTLHKNKKNEADYDVLIDEIENKFKKSFKDLLLRSNLEIESIQKEYETSIKSNKKNIVQSNKYIDSPEFIPNLTSQESFINKENYETEDLKKLNFRKKQNKIENFQKIIDVIYNLNETLNCMFKKSINLDNLKLNEKLIGDKKPEINYGTSKDWEDLMLKRKNDLKNKYYNKMISLKEEELKEDNINENFQKPKEINFTDINPISKKAANCKSTDKPKKILKLVKNKCFAYMNNTDKLKDNKIQNVLKYEFSNLKNCAEFQIGPVNKFSFVNVKEEINLKIMNNYTKVIPQKKKKKKFKLNLDYGTKQTKNIESKDSQVLKKKPSFVKFEDVDFSNFQDEKIYQKPSITDYRYKQEKKITKFKINDVKQSPRSNSRFNDSNSIDSFNVNLFNKSPLNSNSEVNSVFSNSHQNDLNKNKKNERFTSLNKQAISNPREKELTNNSEVIQKITFNNTSNLNERNRNFNSEYDFFQTIKSNKISKKDLCRSERQIVKKIKKQASIQSILSEKGTLPIKSSSKKKLLVKKKKKKKKSTKKKLVKSKLNESNKQKTNSSLIINKKKTIKSYQTNTKKQKDSLKSKVKITRRTIKVKRISKNLSKQSVKSSYSPKTLSINNSRSYISKSVDKDHTGPRIISRKIRKNIKDMNNSQLIPRALNYRVVRIIRSSSPMNRAKHSGVNIKTINQQKPDFVDNYRSKKKTIDQQRVQTKSNTNVIDLISNNINYLKSKR